MADNKEIEKDVRTREGTPMVEHVVEHPHPPAPQPNRPDDNDATVEESVEQIQEALERDDVNAAVDVLERLDADEQVEVFDELELEEQAEVLSELDPETSADILVELHEDDQVALAKRVDDETLSDILDEMEPDDAADVIGDLPEDRQARVLAGMEEADDVRPLLIHPDDSAGGLMTNAFLALRPEMNAQQAINALREWGPNNETAYYLFVVDRDRHLVGIVSLRHLITSPPYKHLSEMMSTDVVSVPVGTDQEECAKLLRKYGFMALPVVDAEQRLLGVITVDDLVDVIEEEAAEDTFRLAGVSDEERIWSPISVSMKKRLPWLMINLGTAFFAAWVYSLFNGTVDALPFLAALPTMVAGQGGNAATQRITILVRGLATGEVDLQDTWRVIIKEVWIGLLQGLALALVVGVGVAVWKNSPLMGIILAVAMIGNMLVAGLVGTGIPFLLRLLKIDPALASAVVVTTFTDCCGFAFSLGLATLLLNQLK